MSDASASTHERPPRIESDIVGHGPGVGIVETWITLREGTTVREVALDHMGNKYIVEYDADDNPLCVSWVHD